MRRGWAAVLVLALAWPGAGTAAEQEADPSDLLERATADAPFTISADEVSYEQDREIYEAIGNVRIEQEGGGGRLQADWVTFNPQTRVGIAVGNVRIEQGSDTLTAEFATVDLNTLQALATDASLDSGQVGFRVRGKTLEKKGETTYRAEGGRFTTCRCSDPADPVPWEVEAGEADIEVDGYAEVRDAKLRVLGIPVFYTPYLLLPVKTTRQSGFLIPEYSSNSDDGHVFEVPFFWAPREDLNLLLRPSWLSKRGFKYAGDFEYVFGEEGYSTGGGAILPGDREIDRDDVETPYSDDRWAYWLRHEQPLAEALRFGTDVRQVSDNDYVVDFDDLDDHAPGAESSRFIDSTAWLSASRLGLYGSVAGELLDDMQSPNNLDRDSRVLERLPDVTVTAPLHRLGPLPLYAGTDARYTYFYNDKQDRNIGGQTATAGQFFDTGVDGLFNLFEPDANGVQAPPADPNVPNDFSLDDANNPDALTRFEGDGVFQEGELLADRGHRVDLFPHLTLVEAAGPIEVLAEGGLRQTLYSSRNLGSSNRGMWTGRFEARSRLMREFELAGTSLTHVLEPGIAWGFVSPATQDSDPLFIPQGAVPLTRLVDGDLRLLARNPSDRIDRASLGLGWFENRIFGASPGDGRAPREVAWLRLGGGYDFRAGRIAPFFLESHVEPSRSTRGDVWLGWDTKKGNLDEALVRALWEHPDGHEFAASYRWNRDLPLVFENFEFSPSFDNFDQSFDRISQINLDAYVVVGSRFDVFARGYGSFEDQTVGGTLGVVLHSECRCWELVVAGDQSVRDSSTGISVQLRLAGLGSGRRTRARSY